MHMGGSLVKSCSACSVVYMWYVLGCVLVREGNKKQTKFTATYVQSRLHTAKPGKSSYPLPEKNFESTPRELLCSDRAQTSTTGSGRPSCVDELRNLAKSARTKRYDPKTDEKQTEKSHIYTYTYRFFLKDHYLYRIFFRNNRSRLATAGCSVLVLFGLLDGDLEMFFDLFLGL